MKKGLLNIKLLLSYSKKYIYLLVISAIATIIKVAASFATPQIIRFTVDYIIDDIPFSFSNSIMYFIDLMGGREGIKRNIWISAAFILVFALITALSDYIGRLAIAKGTEGIMKDIRNRLFEHIQKLPFSWHIKNQTGDIIQRATSDAEVVRNFINVQLSEMFRIIMLVIISLVLMFSMNVKLTLIVLAFIPVVILYSAIFYGILSKKFLVADEAEGELFNTIQENLTGVRVVRAFGREKYEIEKFSQKNNKFSDLWVRLGYQLGYYWGIGDFVTGLLVMMIVIIGSIYSINNIITLGEFIAFTSYTTMLAWPLRGFGRILGELSKTSVSAERICEILREPEEQERETLYTPELNKDIEYKDVTFNYEGNIPVVNKVSFKINAGTTFAILGGTGSGKTTLMHLLNRLYELPESDGIITIGGVDIRDIKLEYLRRNIGMVLQEPFLFSRSIKENISIVNPEIDFASIKEVSSIAQIDESIENFSKGYDTTVGERGVTLSGGQKQRVAIARMILQDTPIMVFDDSLSAVDSETDAKIRSALKKGKRSATVILISHRITTLMQADKILVLEKGKISDIGTHEELIRREGIYKNIYEVQMNLSDIEKVALE